ncbi:MAG: hypothetical protein L7F78_17795, partial [Syntrophales bacterium LBB04]|nr:hypothetical protein [Syntrophales bacterium LBB04]
NEKKLPPEVFGELTVTRGTSLWQVFHEIYGSTDTAFFSKFTKMNPNIKNINILQTGETVVIPAVPATGESVTKRVWVQVARMDKLSEAYEFLRSYSGNNNSLMIFPFWNQHDGLVFAVMLKGSFTKTEDASASMKQPSSPAYRDKKILDAWDGDTVFYRRLGDKS